MVERAPVLALLAALATALALGLVGAGPVRAKAKNPQCKFTLKADWLGNRHGTARAPITCSEPYGRGVWSGTYTVRTTIRSVHLSVAFTITLSAGTLRGKFTAGGAGLPTLYIGATKHIVGTGAYAGARPAPVMLFACTLQGSTHVGCGVGFKLAYG
jgi:hypothetical protein